MVGFLQITVSCVKRNPLVVEEVHPRTGHEVLEGNRVIAVLFPLTL